MCIRDSGYTKQTGRRCRSRHPSMVIRRHGSRNSWTRTFQYSTSALGSRWRHQESAARIEGMHATSDVDKADNWHHTTWNTAATTSRIGKIEPRTGRITSDRSIKRASKWVVWFKQSMHSVILNRSTTTTTNDKLLTTPYRMSIHTSVLPLSVSLMLMLMLMLL